MRKRSPKNNWMINLGLGASIAVLSYFAIKNILYGPREEETSLGMIEKNKVYQEPTTQRERKRVTKTTNDLEGKIEEEKEKFEKEMGEAKRDYYANFENRKEYMSRYLDNFSQIKPEEKEEILKDIRYLDMGMSLRDVIKPSVMEDLVRLGVSRRIAYNKITNNGKEPENITSNKNKAYAFEVLSQELTRIYFNGDLNEESKLTLEKRSETIKELFKENEGVNPEEVVPLNPQDYIVN